MELSVLKFSELDMVKAIDILTIFMSRNRAGVSDTHKRRLINDILKCCISGATVRDDVLAMTLIGPGDRKVHFVRTEQDELRATPVEQALRDANLAHGDDDAETIVTYEDVTVINEGNEIPQRDTVAGTISEDVQTGPAPEDGFGEPQSDPELETVGADANESVEPKRNSPMRQTRGTRNTRGSKAKSE